jgi:hypothetical protein
VKICTSLKRFINKPALPLKFNNIYRYGGGKSMNEPRAYGSFVKRGANIYRTSAYIQWGNSDKSIGACLLLNPGSATLDDEISSLLDKNGFASGWVKTEDPTMEQLILFVEGIYGKEITGRLHIYNLFNLQNTKSVHAVDQFESLIQSGEYDLTESLVSLDELNTHPWILIGWGVRRESRWTNLELIKREWRNLISEARIPTFGKKHPKRDDYYHLCPRIQTDRQIILGDLIEIYKRKFNVQRFTIHATKPNLIKDLKSVEVFDDNTDGWQRTSANPESIVRGFSQLSIKKDYKLRAYQYHDGGNGNGIVWAIPEDKKLPNPIECERLKEHFLDAPKPSFALEDFMEAIDGDKTPLSYLQASIVYHELHEFGAVWHGVSWGRDVILPLTNDSKLNYEWEMLEDEPDLIEPHYYHGIEGNPIIVFHTINDIGTVTLNRYEHVFSKEDYTLEVKRTCIATAGWGIIF